MRMVDADQIRQHVVVPVLRELGLWSEAAERLVLGTGAHESGGFRWLAQVRGPALSWFQIEPATYYDLLDRTLPGLERRAPELVMRLRGLVPRRYDAFPPAEYLARDQGYATAICRLLYYRVPRALPAANDLAALAAYWKRYYNTAAGRGTPEQWLHAAAACGVVA